MSTTREDTTMDTYDLAEREAHRMAREAFGPNVDRAIRMALERAFRAGYEHAKREQRAREPRR
ncbi:MAG: hypothetical protein IPN34_21215 [Planctomycetes bacterium]|nr:hypothetical protein [Planctomycetota bacterium]